MWKRVLSSFGYAGSGFLTLVSTQLNARIHLMLTAVALGLGAVLRIEYLEWALVVFAISLVWVAEALNTAIEALADVVTREHHPGIKRAKDVAAAGVLISAVGALVIGLLVFVPRLL